MKEAQEGEIQIEVEDQRESEEEIHIEKGENPMVILGDARMHQEDKEEPRLENEKMDSKNINKKMKSIPMKSNDMVLKETPYE